MKKSTDTCHRAATRTAGTIVLSVLGLILLAQVSPRATVTGHWTGAASDTFSVTTDSSGKATDYSNSAAVPSGSVFTCVVGAVSKSGWNDDSAANKQTSGSVTVP